MRVGVNKGTSTFACKASFQQDCIKKLNEASGDTAARVTLEAIEPKLGVTA